MTGKGPYRIERDLLGDVSLAADALIGINTARSVGNFAVSGRPLGSCRALVRGLALVKQAAARANCEVGALDKDRCEAIVAACIELARGDHDRHLVCDLLEGSGGTSVNMNVNEVVANLALIRLGTRPGDYRRLSPNDHVNLGQSTNDAVPTAVQLAVHGAAAECVEALTRLGASLMQKRDAFAGVMRLGRTCMQDAQPMTLGQLFGGYAAAINRQAVTIARAQADLLSVPLGGTAVGTGFGVHPGYRAAVIRWLGRLYGADVRAAGDAFDAMQNADSLARLSGEVRTMANILWKIGNDFVILASGPDGGLGELRLPDVQAGSSIMPGKVNPVIPMTVCQAALAVNGNDVAVSLAAQQGLLDLNHYELLIADRLLDSLAMMTGVIDGFARHCIAGLEADEVRSWAHLVDSSALATVLVPRLGYSRVAELVAEARASGRTFISHAVAQAHLTESEIRELLVLAATAPEDAMQTDRPESNTGKTGGGLATVAEQRGLRNKEGRK